MSLMLRRRAMFRIKNKEEKIDIYSRIEACRYEAGYGFG